MDFNLFQNNNLLKSVESKGWKLFKLTDILKDETKKGTKIKKENYLFEGKYPIIDQGNQFIAGYSNEETDLYDDFPLIIFGDHTRALKYIDFSIYLGADGVKLLKVKNNINTKYIYYYLKSVNLPNDGYSRHYKYLKDVIVPIPCLGIQNKIVLALDKAQNLISIRQAQIKLLDELVKSRFIEMFGDLENNIYEFDKLKMREICSKITDGTHKTPKYTNEGIKFISAKDIKTGKVDLSNTKYISLEEYNEIQGRCQLEVGDILLSKSGSIGTPVVLDTDEPLGIFESLAVLKLEKNIINNIYLCEFLKSYSAQRRIVFGTKGISIKHLHLNVLKELDVLLPPMELQNKFADFVKQVDKLKFEMEKNLRELEDNFNSLMQKAFKGELFE